LEWIGDGGKDLEKWVKQVVKTKRLRGEIPAFWREVSRLFRGLCVFQKNDLVHHDLKPQNIVYRMEEKRLNFIDFGLMRSIKTEGAKCRDVNSCQANPHWNYPTDVLFMNQKVFDSVAKQTAEQRLTTYEGYMKDLRTRNKTLFVDAFRILFIDSFPKMGQRRNAFHKKYWMGFKDLILQLQPGNYNDFLQKALSGFDVFGLGFTLLYVVSRFEPYMKPNMVSQLDDLFFRMMTPNVFVRLTAEQSLAEYNKIMSVVS
jgi:serine/threonine protein kinase